MEGELFVWRYSLLFLVGIWVGNLHWHLRFAACCLAFLLCSPGGRGFILAFTGSGENPRGCPFLRCKSVPLRLTVYRYYMYGEM